jgi:hypothetical protein
MSIPEDTPLDRAQAKLEQIERQLSRDESQRAIGRN